MNLISVLHTESSCGWGGQELRILTEAEEFQRHGHRVGIAAPGVARICHEARQRGILVRELPIARKRPRGVWALREEFATGNWNVINTHSSTDSWLSALAIRTLPAKTQVPLVRTRHISAPLSPNAPTRWLYRAATAHVVTTGEALREQVIAELGLDAAQVTSVPTGIDLARYRPGDQAAARVALGLPPDAYLIGIVATLRSWKGHRYLVDALAGLERPRAQLIIVGDGPGRDNLRQQIATLGIADRVRMVGNQQDVVPWLRAMDVFVLPSYANEGVPQAIMQAMACRRAVVTTPVGSIEEIVEHDVTGYMTAPRDVEALRHVLELLHDEPSLRDRLAEAGYVQAKRRFSSEEMYRRMAAIFQTVCNGIGSAAAVSTT